MKRRCEEGLPSLRTVDDTIPEPLSQLVARCIERDAALRYQTTAELCAALYALDDAGELIPIPPRISKRMMGALALLVVALIGVTYFVGRRFAAKKALEKRRDVVRFVQGRDDDGDHGRETSLAEERTCSRITLWGFSLMPR